MVVPVHDFYLSGRGREWITTMAKNVLAKSGIEVLTIDWGESATV
jgi:hypothetical protein